MEKMCVYGYNLKKYTDQKMTVNQCKKLCEDRSDCLAIEYGRDYNGNGNIAPGDCLSCSPSLYKRKIDYRRTKIENAL